jgi:CRP/FNR family transcriptional regulator
MLRLTRHAWKDAGAEWRTGEFYKDLSAEAMSEFERLAIPHSCAGNTVIFSEEQEACRISFLLEGRVKLTMSSSDGKRLTLGIAGPGEVLGLAAAMTGRGYETTAIAQFPCRIVSLPRSVFFEFLLRFPAAWQNLARLLSMDYKRGCERLRIITFVRTSPLKLAKLFLQWGADGQRTGFGVRIHCSLTHEQIGEYIGLSRETVTRCLTKFKNKALVEQHGSTFWIPSLRALEMYGRKSENGGRPIGTHVTGQSCHNLEA